MPVLQELVGAGDCPETDGRTDEGKPTTGSGRGTDRGRAVSDPQGGDPPDPRVCMRCARLHVCRSRLQSVRRCVGMRSLVKFFYKNILSVVLLVERKNWNI